MSLYIGTKIIKAEPLSLGEYNKGRGWTIPADENPDRPGYLVTYPDKYLSWSPKEVFEQAYRLIGAAEYSMLSTELCK